MKKLLVLTIGLTFCLTACQNPTSETAAEANAEASDVVDGKTFGESFTKKDVESLQSVLTKLDNTDSLFTQVTGTIESVCQVKGCWANVTSDGVEGELFVKFKDYGFFLPLDCSGKKVTLNGKAFNEVTSVDELRHYAEDEGKSKEEIEAITEPKTEKKFLASGVILE